MKKNIKKIIVGMFGLFMFLGLATGASASSVWNGVSNDCPDINIANYTTNTGYGSPCWYGTNISAKPGDVINVKVYYHNTSSATATNVRLKIFSPSGSSNSHSFSAQILSDQGNLYTGTVSVNLSASSSLSLLSTKWYPNQSSSNSSLLNGQSSSAVTSSNGLYIGSIAPGWSTQGTINVAFKVNEVVEPETCKDTSATNYGGPLPCVYPQKICTISNFSASDYSITQGESSTLSWNTTNCTSATIYPALGSVNTSGSRNVSPTSSTTYTLSASGNGTSDTDTVTINVSIPPQLCKDTSATNYGGSLPCVYPQKICTIKSFYASDSSITKGSSSKLYWDTENCTSVTIYPDVGRPSVSGSQNVYPSSSTTYTLLAYGNDGTKTKQLTISVNNVVPEICKDTSATNYGGSLPCVYSKPMSGNLSPSSSTCTIASGSNSCSLSFSWSTTNPVGVSAVTHDEKTIAVGNNGSKAFTIEGGSAQTYYLYNNGVRLDVETVRGECEYGSVWAGSYCAPIAVKTCSIDNFSASDYSITQGESSTLSWNTNNCTSVNISNIGTVNTSGSKYVYPTSSTTYTLSASGANGTQTKTVTINVSTIPETCKDTSATNYGGSLPCTYPNLMSGNIEASSSSCTIASGSSTCNIPFHWTTQNPKGTSAITHDYLTVANGNSGNKTFTIEEGSQTYYLYNNGQLLDTETVSASCASNSSWNGSYCAPVVVSSCRINNFYASNYSITEGGSSKLYWNTENCTSVNISNIGTVSSSGSQGIWPNSTTTYTLNAYGANDNQTSSVTVYVNDNGYNDDSCRIDNFTANDTYIEEGDSVRLKWNTTGCNTVKISDGVGYVDDDGSETVYPDEDITYTLTAYNNNGYSKTKTLRIYVDEDNSNDSDSCTIDSFTANDTRIDRGDSSKLKWNTTGCDNVTLSGVGYVDDDGSETVYPNYTTTYTLKAYGDRTRTKSLTISVNTYSQTNYPVAEPTVIYNSNVVTVVATNITQNSAQLNGILTSGESGSSNSYFEYGTTMNLGSRTNSRTVNNNTNFSSYINGLSSDTIYYFQAVSEGQNGVSRGAIEVFKTSKYVTTKSNTTSNTTTSTKVPTTNKNTSASNKNIIKRTVTEEIVQGETVYGSTSPLILEITNKYRDINKGDVIDYSIYYKNISSSVLTNPMIQVHIPEGITVTNLSGGIYSQEDKTVSIPINDLNPEDEGRVYIEAKVNSVDLSLAQIVTTALLIYTNPNNAQENAMAYVLNNPVSSGNSTLGASAFFSGMFGGSTLIGWLLFIIVALLIIIVARSFYNKKATENK